MSKPRLPGLDWDDAFPMPEEDDDQFEELWRQQQSEGSTHNVPPSEDQSGRVDTGTVEEEARPASSQTAQLTRHEPEVGIQDDEQHGSSHKRPRWGVPSLSEMLEAERLVAAWEQRQSPGVVSRAAPLRWKDAWQSFSNPEPYTPSDEGAAASQCRCGTQLCAAHFKLRSHRSQRVWRCLFGNDGGHTLANA